MLLVSFDASHDLYPLVHDHLSNTGFVDIGRRVKGGVMTVGFESAAFDPDDELEEANDHEEGVLDGEYSFIRHDLQQMAFDRDAGFVLTFSFKPHTGSDDDYAIFQQIEAEEVTVVDDTKMKNDLREILRLLAEDD
jgi:hypothetical protein